MALPGSVDPSQFKLDGRMYVYRSLEGYGMNLEGDAAYLIRKWEYTRDSTVIVGVHANSLKDRRYVLYDKSTIYADKSTPTPADNLINTIWKENAGASINAARDGVETQADISAYVTTEGDASKAAAITMQIGRRNLGEVITEITEASSIGSNYLAAEIVAEGEGSLELRTFYIARGADRGPDSKKPLIFSEENGSLQNAKLIVDRVDEKTVVVAVGAGDDDLRLVQVAIDTNRIADSPLNRIEHVIQLSNIDDDIQLLAAANAELRNHEPLIYLTAEIPATSPYVRGPMGDYNYGDRVGVEFRGIRYTCRLDSLRTYVGPSSRTTQIILRSLTT
jgi:hypothetical protein